jgi:uncharacterized protein YbjT (DUF2867 family)
MDSSLSTMDRLTGRRFTEPMNTTPESPTLVVGGTGKTGRRVARRLSMRDRPVRFGSRRGRPPFDWDDESTWSEALRGAGAAYVTFVPDLAFPGAPEKIGTFASAALGLGVRRLVLLSGRGEDGAQASERVLQESGADWTIVRSAWFCQNFSEDFLLGGVLGGIIALPAGRVAEPFIDVEDIADVVVAALTDDRHIEQVYEVTGPRLMTFADVATELTEAMGRTVRYVPVTPDEFVAEAVEHGVPIDQARALAHLFGAVLDGRNARLADGVERAVGRPARDFADYARATAATGVWNVPVPSGSH